MTLRIFVVFAVAFVSACGGRTPPPSTPNRAAVPAVPESNTSDDYVVGPFVTKPETNGEDGVRTYYIVRQLSRAFPSLEPDPALRPAPRPAASSPVRN